MTLPNLSTAQTLRTLKTRTRAQYYCGPKSHSIEPGEAHLERLMQMLTYKRPHGSKSEAAFIERFLQPALDIHPSWVDAYGNMYVDLRTSPKHRTLFTSHVDTVHNDEGRQTVNFDPKTGDISVLDGSCLGADDGAGLAMLLHMIEHNVPALYVFTRNEEHGGVGARHIVEHHTALLSDFDRAIAFDRQADYSVITHQGGRCCSDEFAEALSAALCNDDIMYAPDSTGIYTCTAEFVDVVPECSNLSIGYSHQHTEREVQNLYHFQHLAEAVLTVPWDNLPVERDPNVREAHSAWGWGSYLPPLTSGAYADWPDLDDELEAQRVDDIDWLLGSMGYMGLDAADLNYDELAAASAACEFIYDGRDTELRELLKTHAQCELQIPAAMDAETLKEWLEQCLIAGVSVATRALANVFKGE